MSIDSSGGPRWQKPVGMLAILALIAIWCVGIVSLIAVDRAMASAGADGVLCGRRDCVAVAAADAADAELDGDRAVEIA